MNNYEGIKYYTTKEGLKETLAKYGVAIIPSILDNDECNNMLNGIWDYIEHITKNMTVPILRNNKKTWNEIYKLYPLHSMLIQYWNVGHAQASWDVRMNPKIIEVFSHFWKTDASNLLVSFDGLSFNLPPEITKRGWNKNNTWESTISKNHGFGFHTDQSFTRNDFECVQSWVTALDVNEGDATLAFIEGSHSLHKDFATNFNIVDKKDWYKLNTIEEKFYLDKTNVEVIPSYKKIKCPKGSLVLWDSRTIHCGVEAMKGRTQMNLRAVIYLCYMPRDKISEKALEKALVKKRNAFNNLRTTNHNVSRMKLFPNFPRTYGGEIPNINIINTPVLNKIGMKLAGF